MGVIAQSNSAEDGPVQGTATHGLCDANFNFELRRFLRDSYCFPKGLRNAVMRETAEVG